MQSALKDTRAAMDKGLEDHARGTTKKEPLLLVILDRSDWSSYAKITQTTKKMLLIYTCSATCVINTPFFTALSIFSNTNNSMLRYTISALA